MAWRHRTAADHGRLWRALVLILAVSPAIAAIAALPFGTGTHATAQTRGTALAHVRVRTHARAQAAVAPRVVFKEDFENGIGTMPVELENYHGSTGETYTAAAEWLRNCNGEIINYNMTALPIHCNGTSTPPSTSASGMRSLRALAYALGSFQGNGTGNSALAAYTDTGAPQAVDPGCADPNYPAMNRWPERNPSPAQTNPYPTCGTGTATGATGRVQFQTNQPISLPTGSTGHLVTFSVNVATINCPGTISGYTTYAPLLRFRLLSGASTADVGGELNPCTTYQRQITVNLPPGQGSGSIAARVGTLQTSVPIPNGWTSFNLQLINDQANGAGNDSAIDNIQILDATPQLTKSFSPSSLPAGSVATLTFTINNTTDVQAKLAWSFTETLPSDMTVANPPNVVSTCAGGSVTAPSGSSAVTPGSTSFMVSGSGLAAGVASCTVSINVTALFADTYQNGPSNITSNVQILAPTQTTTVTFTEPGILCFTAYPANKELPSVTVGLRGGVTEDYLGAITVWDDRAEHVAGWTVTVTSTDFTTVGAGPAGTIPATDATYAAGPVTTTGTITVTNHTPITLSNAAQNVLTATGSYINLASWDPRLSVSVPATAVPGTYHATITHSVY